MTEREMLLKALERIGQRVYYDEGQYVEFNNSVGPESIVVKFDENGNIVSIYC